MIPTLPKFLFVSILLIGSSASVAQAQSEIRFNRDVRPILSQACFRCHGFDEKTREGDLRLDTVESATVERDAGKAAITPGNLEKSLLWERVIATDPDMVMPPPSSNRQLTLAEKETLKKWIEQGAKYENHWSFEPISPMKEPLNIDALLSAEIQKRNLQPTTVADPVTLARRVAFTSTGLPPKRADIEGFLKSPSSETYEGMIDTFLASPHYGEEMAKHWLDVARYGDTHGLHLDNERTMWAYRDWVIQSFNDNLPFNQFTIDQIAGDLLPNPSQSQLVATGFNRCNVTTSEGGAINEEFLYRYAVDRTSTVIQTWLGLTGGCAVCHDHKFDPLSTRDFYSMYAFFYSAADPAMDGNIAETKPFLPLKSEAQKRRLDKAKADEQKAKDALLKIAKDRVARSPIQVAQVESPTDAKVLQTSIWIDDLFPMGASTRNTSRNPEVWIANESAPMGRRYLKQAFGNKFDQSVNGGWPSQVVPENGELRFWVMPDRFEPPKAIFVSIKSGNKTVKKAWTHSNEWLNRIGYSEDQVAGPLPKAGVWTQLSLSLSELPAQSTVQEIHFGLFDGVCSWDGFVSSGTYTNPSNGSDWQTWWASQKGKDAEFAKGPILAAIKEGPDSENGKKLAADVEAHYFAFVSEQVSEELRAKRSRWQKARIDYAIVDNEVPGTLIYNDTEKPRDAFVMKRGQYDQKGEPVVPATPGFLSPLKKSSPDSRATRLDLAKWLVAPENPLTARVTVNRIWQQVFGVGLVKTSDDFGTQGTLPTHPELLDALSDEFIKTGWDVKRLMKKLMMTQAFQRSAVCSDDVLRDDPENRFLARGPRIRLDAEQIRDNVLASANLLNRQLGGPGFKGYQPPGIWEPVGYGDSNTRYYIQDHGPTIYRRSIYAFLKRTAPPPFMTNFDAPNREQFCTRRERSNTPLQALQLMNDIQYVEAARVLAEKVWGQNLADDHSRIRHVYQQVLTRDPTQSEADSLARAYQKFRAKFQTNPSDATKLLAVGESPRVDGLPAVEVAALSLLINLVMNLDEFVNRN